MCIRERAGTRRKMADIRIETITGQSCDDDGFFEKLSALDRQCVGTDGWSADSFRSHAQTGVLIAAFCKEQPVGVLAGFTASGTGEVLTVAVSPEFRRMGAARGMLGRFLELLPAETENIALEVRASNTAAIALYESFGFERQGVRKRFYRDPAEDAIVMVKEVL